MVDSERAKNILIDAKTNYRFRQVQCVLFVKEIFLNHINYRYMQVYHIKEKHCKIKFEGGGGNLQLP